MYSLLRTFFSLKIKSIKRKFMSFLIEINQLFIFILFFEGRENNNTKNLSFLIKLNESSFIHSFVHIINTNLIINLISIILIH